MSKKIKFKISELSPKTFLVLLLAGIINAFGVTMFLFPVKLYDSGISGLSMLLDQVTPKNIIYFIVNRFQINRLKKIVHSIDPSAFISLQDVSDIIRKNEN